MDPVGYIWRGEMATVRSPFRAGWLKYSGDPVSATLALPPEQVCTALLLYADPTPVSNSGGYVKAVQFVRNQKGDKLP